MFKIGVIYEVDRSLLRCDYVRFSLAWIDQIDRANNQVFFDIPTENS